MEYVHFLNLEYLLLRVYDILHNSSLFTGAYATATGPESGAVNGLTILLGSLAVVGMLLSIIFFVLVVWLRIKTIILEHEGFEAKDETLRASVPNPEGEPQVVGPKNVRWERVHELANSANENDWRLAILEADIMLADLLKDQGYRGESIGERLRDANPLQFLTLDLAWKAHKTRNDIAHAGSDFHLSQRDANATIDFYRRVFEEFNFI